MQPHAANASRQDTGATFRASYVVTFVVLLGGFLVFTGSRGLRPAQEAISRERQFRSLDNNNHASSQQESTCSVEPDPRLHLVTPVLGSSPQKWRVYMEDVKGLLTQVLASSKRPVTLHIMTNVWDDVPELAARAELARKELLLDPRVEYVPYRYCELRLNLTTGLPQCPPAGAPAKALPGAVEFTRVYASFDRQWPGNDNVHLDTESYVLKLFAHAWMAGTQAGAAAREALVIDSDVDIVGDVGDLLSQGPGGPLGIMRARGALLASGLEMQPVYSLFWKNVPPVGRGFNTGVVGEGGGGRSACLGLSTCLRTPRAVLDICALRRSAPYAAFLAEFDWDAPRYQPYASHTKIPQHLGDQTMMTILNATIPGGSPLFHVLDCTWNRQVCRMLKAALKGDEVTPMWEQAFVCPHPIRILHYCGRTRGEGINLGNYAERLEVPAIREARWRSTIDWLLADPTVAPWAKDAAKERLAAPEPLL